MAGIAWGEFNKYIAALCAWREARDQGNDGIRAVLHVINNRAKARKKSWAQIVYEPQQFSSMTHSGDPQIGLVPRIPDTVFETCYSYADKIYNMLDDDNTGGADHYYARTITTPPEWAASMTPTNVIGDHLFFKS